MKKILWLVFLLLFLPGCFQITISRSDKRNPVPASLEVSPGITLTTWGAVKVQKTDFFPASFRIKAEGKVIYIDPLQVEDTLAADYIFITHDHPDHFSPEDIKRLATTETLIICPKSVAKQLSGYHVREVKPGELFKLGNIQCETVVAYNLKPVFLWITAHPKNAGYVGYILTINGVRIYHPGDSDFIPEMKELKDITVALVPIDGGNLTMDLDQAAAVVNELKPAIAIPMHYEIGKEKAEKFKEMVNEGIEVTMMEATEN